VCACVGVGVCGGHPVTSALPRHTNKTTHNNKTPKKDWAKHCLSEPDDVASQFAGRFVSKDYGRHEPPHTERHAWRTHDAAEAAHQCEEAARAERAMRAKEAQQQQQQQQQHEEGEGEGQQRGGLAPPAATAKSD
jgi:hypothetical protein